MPEVKQGDTVKVHYTGRLNDGEVFDSSLEREPLEFTVGSGEVIAGFEQAVQGMSPGDTKTVTMSPAEAYGDYDDGMVHKISRSNIPEDVELEPGMMVQASREDNEVIVLTVREIDEESVTLDANHPLAGKDLTFDIELVAIVA